MLRKNFLGKTSEQLVQEILSIQIKNIAYYPAELAILQGKPRPLSEMDNQYQNECEQALQAAQFYKNKSETIIETLGIVTSNNPDRLINEVGPFIPEQLDRQKVTAVEELLALLQQGVTENDFEKCILIY